MQKLHATRALCALAVLAWVLPQAAVWTGPAESKEEAWKAERRKLEALAETKVAERVKQAISAKKVAEQLKFPWPVEAPTMTEAKIKAEIKKRVEAAVDRKYPMNVVETYAKEAEEMYALHKQGDDVSFVIRGGRGMNATVSGPLRDINELRMRVGNRWVVRTDVEEEVLARFDPTVQAKYIERYVRVQTNKYKFTREAYGKEVEAKTEEELYTKANYTLWPKTGKHRKWRPVKEVVDQAVAFIERQYASRVRKQIQKQVFTGKGYILYQGEWMPKQVAESVQDKLKKMLEDKKSQQQAPKEGQMGGEQGMMEGAMGAGMGAGAEGAQGGGMAEGMDPAMMGAGGGEGGMMGGPGMGGEGKKKKK